MQLLPAPQKMRCDPTEKYSILMQGKIKTKRRFGLSSTIKKMVDDVQCSGGHACRDAASAKPFGNAFAGALQAPNRSGMHLQELCKHQTIRECICRSSASTKPFGNAFAGALQAQNRSGMHLQKLCKRKTVRECICRNAASVRKSGITLWYRQFLY